MSRPPSRTLEALDALKHFDRERAAALLHAELRDGPAIGDRWKSIGMLAGRIGEIDTAIEAARRYAATPPVSMSRLMHYWGELANYGRTAQARAAASALPMPVREHPSIQHFLGTTAGEQGDFAAAEAHYRRALAIAALPETWFALAMIHRFTADDPDIAAMEQLRPTIARGPPQMRARFLYGLAKAWSDAGDPDRAFELYHEGAALRREERAFDAASLADFAERVISAFTPDAMAALTPPRPDNTRAIFVNGLPRSGTTLIEQMLTSHSAVTDGGEINLLRAALIPTGDFLMTGATAYQNNAASGDDPWGKIAATYHRMLDMRFGQSGRIVDKTLGQSHLMGLLLHTLPDARIIWMRRDPADTALSCFRTFFTAPTAWSWSFEDIADFFRIEDRLFAHWTGQFSDNILVVPYEDLVRDPIMWLPRILSHTGLPPEPGLLDFHTSARSVRTASVQQVRAPISATRVGAASGFERQMTAFRERYYRT
ncbi:tetratricopeptide repeat-containing sulfotransferase family protein [Sphingomonas japonica]|uniref:Tetratricopeptide (TPR) repeat protein n=1 Tax=Sphingomonas japonica TaxID=511662 RepID=A0ABX0U1B9_9SPHN|nr:sulfotransferase [Sphingomonas japonica]NIJ23890.1 tetratricopeptide (TPR) repeat protein [Sphingomonas japonica]